MISLNDVLLAMSNVPVSDPIAEIWGRGLQGGYEIIEYTGALPLTITADGNALIDYRIYGNTARDGTPTPEAPVDVVGCGVKTENLCPMIFSHTGVVDDSGGTGSFNTRLWSKKIPVSESQSYYVVIDGTASNDEELNFNRIIQYDANGVFISRINVVNLTSAPFTTSANCRYVVLDIRTRTLTVNISVSDINTLMLNLGSTALPYEPYGYKLPILSNSTTTNIYIGNTQLKQGEYVSYSEQKVYKYRVQENTDNTVIYGFRIDPNESDPTNAVTYIEDAVGMTPAVMGSTAFNYGSWTNAFFMPKPCMLKYDGTVDYYLDPNDFTKKVDGTASDVGNINYAGNAMMEFPKIWFKFETGTADGEGYFYVSNQKVDDTYRCWCNMDADGNEIDHFYVHIYNGVIYDGKMRSLSGKRLTPWSTTEYSSSVTYAVNSIVNYDGKMWKCVTAVETAEAFDSTKWEQFAFNGNTDGTQEVNSATVNNTTAKSEWYIDTWCDRVLITALLYLIGKSLDLQGTFGRGIDSFSQTAAEAYVTGAANDKGLFYGSTSNGYTVVKVFGIENFWACKWHRMAGLIGNSSGRYSYKMTASTADGSSVSEYNSNGDGYLITTFNMPASNYVRLMEFGAHGALPLNTTSATSETYYCNYFYAGTGYAMVGGSSDSGASCNFRISMSGTFGFRGWFITSALSCKPLAKVIPTDPPIHLPEILTFAGTSVIDYDGEPKPSEMYIKYRR